MIVSRSAHRSARPISPAHFIDVDVLELSAFLLRLAHVPGTIEAGNRSRDLLGPVLEHPVMFRAARLLTISAIEGGAEWEW